MSKLITNTIRHVDGTADNITLDSSQNVTVEGNVTASGNLSFADNGKAKFGTSNDLQLYHYSDNSYIENSTGHLIINSSATTNVDIMKAGHSEYLARFKPDGAVELYYDNSKKLHTYSDGVSVFGNFNLEDDDKIRLGDGSDLQIYHNGTNNMLSAALADNFAIVVHNDGNDSNRWGMRIQTGADDASGTNFALTVSDGDGGHQGYITFTGGTVTYGAFTAHHPCIVPDSDNPSDNANAYPYGTLLETISIEYTEKNGADTERGIRYKVRKTQSANSKKVLGAYGSSMNGGPDNQTNEHQALILGDGHILVNNAGGNIEIGDGICSSATAGIGQKATANPSMIIGIAQEAITFTGSETKLVAVQYGLQQFTPWT